MIIAFDAHAFEDYQHWATQDKKTFRRINSLIKDIARNPFTGIGKPEPLKHAYAGFWSRRINQEHRLIYQVRNNTISIAACRYHYKK